MQHHFTQEMSPNRVGANRLWLLAKLSLSLSLLAVLFWTTDLHALFQGLRALRPSPLLGALVLYWLAQVLSSMRWQVLLRVEGIQVPLRQLVFFYLEGSFFSLFLPTVIGGDIVKGYRIHRQTEGKQAALASIIVERLSGLSALIAVALGALLVSWDEAVAWQILGLAAAFVLGLVVVFSRMLEPFVSLLLRGLHLGRVGDELAAIYMAIQRYRGHRKAVSQAFVQSLVLHVIMIYAYWLVSQALGLGVSFVTFLLLVPVVTVIAMIPVSIAGLGVREGATVYLFGKVGLLSASALSLSLTWFLVTVLASLPGGLIFVLGGHRRDREVGARPVGQARDAAS